MTGRVAKFPTGRTHDLLSGAHIPEVPDSTILACFSCFLPSFCTQVLAKYLQLRYDCFFPRLFQITCPYHKIIRRSILSEYRQRCARTADAKYKNLYITSVVKKSCEIIQRITAKGQAHYGLHDESLLGSITLGNCINIVKLVPHQATGLNLLGCVHAQSTVFYLAFRRKFYLPSTRGVEGTEMLWASGWTSGY